MIRQLRGLYFRNKTRLQKEISRLEKKIIATQNAVRSVWKPQKNQLKAKIDPQHRVERFFQFCRDLEVHPFYVRYKNGGTISQKSSFDLSSEDHSEVNFDEVHLESLLTRARQFLFPNELYFLDDLVFAIQEIFNSDSQFEDFHKKLVDYFNRPLPKTNVEVFLPNGEPAISGRTIYQLFEMELYTGRIHSEHTANPQSHYYPLANANIAVRKAITFTLGSRSLNVVNNILITRNHILRLARQDKKTDLFPALEKFNEENTKLGF